MYTLYIPVQKTKVEKQRGVRLSSPPLHQETYWPHWPSSKSPGVGHFSSQQACNKVVGYNAELGSSSNSPIHFPEQGNDQDRAAPARPLTPSGCCQYEATDRHRLNVPPLERHRERPDAWPLYAGAGTCGHWTPIASGAEPVVQPETPQINNCPGRRWVASRAGRAHTALMWKMKELVLLAPRGQTRVLLRSVRVVACWTADTLEQDGLHNSFLPSLFITLSQHITL